MRSVVACAYVRESGHCDGFGRQVGRICVPTMHGTISQVERRPSAAQQSSRLRELGWGQLNKVPLTVARAPPASQRAKTQAEAHNTSIWPRCDTGITPFLKTLAQFGEHANNSFTSEFEFVKLCWSQGCPALESWRLRSRHLGMDRTTKRDYVLTSECRLGCSAVRW